MCDDRQGLDSNSLPWRLTESGQYFLTSSLIFTSFLCSLGPVWYQPTMRSFARWCNSSMVAYKHEDVELADVNY